MLNFITKVGNYMLSLPLMQSFIPMCMFLGFQSLTLERHT